MTRAYLAGPEVFLSNAIEVLAEKKAICSKFGIEGVSPLDLELQSFADLKKCGLRIARSNLDLIRNCDIVIANITPFRGPSMDPGTAIEMGWGAGLGLVVYAYSNTNSIYIDRVGNDIGFGVDEYHDIDGYEIENFGLCDNLMIPGIVEESGGYLFLGDYDDHSLEDLTTFEDLVRSLSPL